MAVTVDAVAYGTNAADTDVSCVLAVGAGANYVGVVFTADASFEGFDIELDGSTDFTIIHHDQVTSPAIAVVTYVNPTAGNNTIEAYSCNSRSLQICAASFKGVDLTDPTGTLVSSGAANTTDATVVVTSKVGDIVFGGMGCAAAATTDSAGTLIKSDYGGACSYLPGAASVSATFYWAGSVNHKIAYIPIRAAPIHKTRGVKYFHDINDPGGRIYDELGKVVQPWELRPNNWIRVTGLFLPSSREYTSFTQDPELAYIEEVTFSIRGGLRIKTNRGEMTEVLLARAAGGKTL